MQVGNKRRKLIQSKLYDNNGAIKRKQKQFEKNVLSYIVTSMKPLSTVEDVHFIKMIQGKKCTILCNGYCEINVHFMYSYYFF